MLTNSLIKADINLIQTQLEKFENYKETIKNLLKKYEDEFEINIFYASETGSRGLGIDVDDSDFDITGFFTPRNELEYFKIIRKFDKFLKITQDKINIYDKDYDIDIELYDIKEWFRAKVVKNLTSSDFWFESDLIYINKFPEIVTTIRQKIYPPFLLYWGKAKSGLTYNQKDISNKSQCLNKSLMNVITSLLQYFHYQIFNSFPKFNILEEIKFLTNNKEYIIKDGISNEEFNILENTIEIYLNLFEQKKKCRKSTSSEIPIIIFEFYQMCENRYNTKMKKKEICFSFTEEVAQKIYDEIRNLNMSNIV